MVDNPIASILLDANNKYNTHVARQNIYKSFMDQQREHADKVYSKVLSDEDLERLEQIITICERIENEIDVVNEEYNDIVSTMQEFNKDYSKSITETYDLSEYTNDYIKGTNLMNEVLNKLEVIDNLIKKYTDVYNSFDSTMQIKYMDELDTVEPNKDVTSTEYFAEKKAQMLFHNTDNFVNTADCYNSSDALSNIIQQSNENAKVITPAEEVAYKEAVVKCMAIYNDIYQYYSYLKQKFGGSDILNQNMAQVNNILHECNALAGIFQNAIDNPYNWGAVSSAQSEVYRYEALQKDFQIIMDSLKDLNKRVINGTARSVNGRSIPTTISEKDYMDMELYNNVIGDLAREIEEFMMDITADENLRAWVATRYNDLKIKMDAYYDAVHSIGVTDGERVFYTGIYNNEGFGLSLIENTRRELALIANEIRNVINSGKYNWY